MSRLSRIIGAIAALVVWVLAIIYFLLNPRKQATRETTIIKILNAWDWEKRPKATRESTTGPRPALDQTIIADPVDLVTQKDRWQEEQKNEWVEKDIRAWEEEEDDVINGMRGEDVDSQFSVIELKKPANPQDITENSGTPSKKKHPVNNEQFAPESKNHSYLDKPQTLNIYNTFLREELENNRQSSSGPSMVECQIRFPVPHSSKHLPQRADDLSDLDETMESPRAVLSRNLESVGKVESPNLNSTSQGSNPQSFLFGSLNGSGKEVLREPLKDYSYNLSATIVRQHSDPQQAAAISITRSKISTAEENSECVKRLSLLTACESEPLVSKNKRLGATVINRDREGHPAPPIRQKLSGTNHDSGSPTPGSSVPEQQRFSISRSSKRKFNI